MIVSKRAYDPAAATDGYCVLIDRLWPRGVSKIRLRLDAWKKDIAPSSELREWYEHDPAKWPEFQRRYERELRAPAAKVVLDDLARRAKRGRVTLVYASKAAPSATSQYSRNCSIAVRGRLGVVRRRIEHLPVHQNSRTGRDRRGDDLTQAHDVLDARAASQKVVGDDPAVTAPPDRFGAHDRASCMASELSQFVQPHAKFFRLRVVGVIPECRNTPVRVE